MKKHSENFKNGLSLYVGQGGVGVEAVALMTGIKPRTLYAIMSGEMRANWDHGMTLIANLPEPFANMALSGTGLVAHRPKTEQANAWQISRRVLETSGMIGTFLDDGKICHVETAKLRRQIHNQLPSLWGFARSP